MSLKKKKKNASESLTNGLWSWSKRKWRRRIGNRKKGTTIFIAICPSLLRYLLLDYQFCFSKACKTQSFIFPEEICVSRRNFGLLPDNLSLSIAPIPIASIYYLKFYTLLEFLMLIIFTIYIRWIWKYNLYKINKYLS